MAENTQNVIVDEDVTLSVSKSFGTMNEEVGTQYKTIYAANDALFNVWFGLGGKMFHSIANVVERHMENLQTKTENLKNGTAEAVTNFGNGDESREESINVQTTDGSSRNGG